jgi:hypothetical protein
MSTFPDDFFEALADDGGDAAMRLLREAAFESGLDQEPSPRAQPFLVRVSGNRPRRLLR